jgi:hypothetical protein
LNGADRNTKVVLAPGRFCFFLLLLKISI